MKKRWTVFFTVLLTVGLPFAAVAASHEHDHGSMNHEKMEGMNHSGMAMTGDMIMLGDDSEEGVKAMAHLKDVQEAMAKMGMAQTHHFMVMFMDAESGKPIEAGTVAVKIKGPSGSEGEPVKLMGMQGHFGADIALAKKGEYKFKLGTKLADGKKRQFEFEFTLK
ncbi:hypothetical protein DSOUD_1873 [Desulfuromonas soudanensis]|uniref:YtkA-like domain-containing protein n=1 Tax=Desulfuromonas soudanensis TaxID=1603606 RepID=A0A0M4DIB1_9BACT|nr:hypothetical protein [Desulfuromonas soudanensis]ALC16645.1 hypothetical protein DSOUD_1873 [Desulfuromonas soudanensis]